MAYDPTKQAVSLIGNSTYDRNNGSYTSMEFTTFHTTEESSNNSEYLTQWNVLPITLFKKQIWSNKINSNEV